MSVFDQDVITRAQIVRSRLAALRAHQTEERRRLHALVIQDLLDAGYSLNEASRLLGLSRTFVHKESQRDITAAECGEFEAIKAAVEQYVLG